MQIIALIIQVLTLLIFVRAISSWIVPYGSNAEWYRILFVSTEWLLGPIRNLMQKAMGNVMMDFSPIVAILLLQFIGGALLGRGLSYPQAAMRVVALYTTVNTHTIASPSDDVNLLGRLCCPRAFSRDSAYGQ